MYRLLTMALASSASGLASPIWLQFMFKHVQTPWMGKWGKWWENHENTMKFRNLLSFRQTHVATCCYYFRRTELTAHIRRFLAPLICQKTLKDSLICCTHPYGTIQDCLTVSPSFKWYSLVYHGMPDLTFSSISLPGSLGSGNAWQRHISKIPT